MKQIAHERPRRRVRVYGSWDDDMVDHWLDEDFVAYSLEDIF